MRRTTPTTWFDIRGLRDAYRLLAVFRASNPMLGDIPPEDLHWEITWDEGFVPLDMDDPPEVRATHRSGTVTNVTLTCATGPDAVGNTFPVREHVPSFVRTFLLAEERDRGSVD